MHGRISLAAALTLLTALLCAPAANAADARYEGISADGEVAFFSTVDSLVPGDTDIQRDVYERSFDPVAGSYVTRLVSTGPSGGNDGIEAEFYGADEEGLLVFFFTAERLTPDDKDNADDIYVRDLVAKTTERVSRPGSSCVPANCGNVAQHAGVVTGGVLPGGDGVFFTTAERLVAEDTDSAQDVYLRELEAEGSTTLVTRGSASCLPGCGNGAPAASFGGSSADGRRVAFTTNEGMATGDSGSSLDLYLRDLDAGTTQRVSLAGECVDSHGCDPIFKAIAVDGSHVYFETEERLAAEDIDGTQDVYAWSAGVVERVSFGPSGGNAEDNVLFRQLADDRDAAFFLTSERLTPEDADDADDVYVRDLGTDTTTLVSRRDASCGSCSEGDHAVLPPGGVPAEGPRVFFLSEDALTSADEDDAIDVYVRDLDAGTTTLVSAGGASCAGTGCGNQDGFDANFAGASADGTHAFVVTDEPLTSADDDLVADIYERAGGEIELVSTGPEPGSGAHGADLMGVAAGGSHAFFVTREPLTVDDFDAGADVYSRSAVGTLLVSRGNRAELEEELGPPEPVLAGTDPESPGTATAIRVVGEAQAGASIKIYLDSDNCSGEPVGTGSAEGLESPGIAIVVPVDSNSRLRATAEADGIVSDCSQPISYQHVFPDGGGSPGGGSGGGGGKSGDGSDDELVLEDGIVLGRGIVFVTPRTRITFAPAGKTRVRRPVFRFTDVSGQPGTRFRCKVDRARWSRCGSPTKLKRLAPGRHVFQVKAVNAVGEWEPRPVRRPFKLVGGRG